MWVHQSAHSGGEEHVERPSPAPSIKAHSVHIFFVFVPEKNKWAPAVSRGSPPLKNLSPRIEGLQAATVDPLQKLTLRNSFVPKSGIK